ncbi:hypothetical protein [Treponema phagedenis]|uniref:hypothetical protein n=1 Tax=Treponema phagedenis TaxID=162 RepID=UPI002091480B|nr:hypothetical protein [Treponema phagedenis]
MRTKKILLEETAKRYCWASKKEKTKIIDEFTATTGYNRKYAIHVLKNKAVLHTSAFNNVKKVSVKIINKPRKKRMYEPYYGDDVRHEVIRLWEYSTWLCSKRLVVFIRDNLPIKSTLEQLSNCEKCRFPHFCNEVKKCI